MLRRVLWWADRDDDGGIYAKRRRCPISAPNSNSKKELARILGKRAEDHTTRDVLSKSQVCKRLVKGVDGERW
jgi:hypothetical protein